MILLKSLHLSNFLSHSDQEITFKENQKLLIDGNSGSGKSSILEAIIWSLYGQGRTNNVALVRRGSEKAEVVLNLVTPDGDIAITRSITAKGKHTLGVTINGVSHPLTGVKDLQNWIETDLTGASYLLFVNSIAYLQGGAETFVTQTATKRKELLLEIVKSVDFDAYYEKVKKQITREEQRVSNQVEGIRIHTEWLDEAMEKVKGKEATEAAKSVLHDEKVIYTARREHALVEMSKEEERKKAVDAINNTVAKTTLEVKTIKDRINALQEQRNEAISLGEVEHEARADVKDQLQKHESKLEKINGEMIKIVTVNNEKMAMLSSKPLDPGAAAKIKEVEALLAQPEKHNECSAGDACPYFKETLNEVKTYEKVLVDLAAKAYAYKEELSTWQKNYDALPSLSVTDLQKEQSDVQELVKLTRIELDKIDKIERAAEQVASFDERIKEQTLDLATKETQANELATEALALSKLLDEVKLRELSLEVSICETKLPEIQASLDSVNQALGVIVTYAIQIPEKEALIESLKQDKLNSEGDLYRLGLLKEAFGSKGIKTIVIDYILPDLEDKINNILLQMSDFRVVLDTQQVKADGEGNKEGLFITVIGEGGEEFQFEMLSGGEKTKVIVAISEALATLQKCGFRIFDEFVTALDENSLEGFMETMEHLNRNYPQILCVTHIQEIKEMFDDSILCTKHQGLSRIN